MTGILHNKKAFESKHDSLSALFHRAMSRARTAADFALAVTDMSPLNKQRGKESLKPW